ncbi:YciI family protein [Nocardioides stalactiti]|uniref:YciI family protein n=1 Tax=Nocardioides stalactiti TaxID=2755356 RepID=UPI00160005F2|nr:YciI family protein [Nocardioides stalactiti]
MKYVFMFTSDPAQLAGVSEDDAQAVYGKIYGWFQENASVITDSGAELQPVETATTVKHGGVVVDGPFNEAKEVIGGFSVIEVEDMDAAIALAKTWPHLEFPGVAVEIRPMVEDYSQFE